MDSAVQHIRQAWDHALAVRPRVRRWFGISDLADYPSTIGGSQRKLRHRRFSEGDRGVIQQIFGQREYDIDVWEHGRRLRAYMARSTADGRRPLIIDAGANIGASAVFFAQTYPAAHLCAVEPDAGNCAMLRANLAGLDATIFEGAIGCRTGWMNLQDPGRGDWGYVAVRAEEGTAGTRRVPVTTPNEILRELGAGYAPLICKIDIEGGEAELFSDDLAWFDQFPMVVIELHDWMLPFGGTSTNFLRETVQRNFEFLQRGENVFLFNRDLLG